MNLAYRKTWRQLLVLSLLAGLVFLWGLSPGLVENLYAKLIYPVISVSLRTISSLVPFPLGDVLYLLLISYVVYSLFIFGRKLYKKQVHKAEAWLAAMQAIRFTLILYIAFKLLWGLNYSRPSISHQLGISNDRYSEKQLVKLTQLIIQKVNHLEKLRYTLPTSQRKKYSIDTLAARAKASYDKLKQRQPFFDYRGPTAVKPVINSWMITKIGLEGYYNPLSGEANVNMLLPAVDLPFVTAHEIAHQLGVAREDEANLIGYLVATNSNDLNFQYSGYYAILRNILFEIRLIAPDQYEALYKSINPRTIADYKAGIAFWQKHNNQMFGYMSATLDSFLKINNQHKGIDSYQDIVLWVYNIHQEELKQFKDKTLQP
ncbi:DUF3810 domain-containing protein [Pedobacter sp.]|uniref:DUF3810 domain-containing protein n=1 Tax=Pedobacter sp. TaxID=1411316 RepID=UPI003D7F5337